MWGMLCEMPWWRLGLSVLDFITSVQLQSNFMKESCNNKMIKTVQNHMITAKNYVYNIKEKQDPSFADSNQHVCQGFIKSSTAEKSSLIWLE